MVDANKIKLGQFFTKATSWLKPQVIDFISKSKCTIAYDPFAGGGDLLKASKEILKFAEIKGLDIDSKLSWEVNDSLINIPHIDNGIIITNPPYIAKQSASRKKINLTKYFMNSPYDDVYLIALDRMLEAQDYIVAIIPESFINSSYKNKNKLTSITVLEENPFEDTENPVCVVCFDNKVKSLSEVDVYKNDSFINSLEGIYQIRLEPSNSIQVVFNTLSGWLGLRAIDSTDDKTFINFDFKENFDYDWKNNIKVSSRHFSLIDVDVPINKRQLFIDKSNKIVNDLRLKSSDILLTPFKGNTKKGIRRRRLDFKLARAIIEITYKEINGGDIMNNEYYFEYSKEHDESTINFTNPEGFLVISKSLSDPPTDLMIANHNLIDLITTYQTLKSNSKYDENSLNITIDSIANILETTDLINYSSFCIYFQVFGYSYSAYKSEKNEMAIKEKRDFLKKIVDLYINNRHNLYNIHGYSDQVLQVNSDAASSRRKGNVGIKKMEEILVPHGFIKAKSKLELKSLKYCYILPDKGDTKLFNSFLDDNNIIFEFRNTRDNKNPDLFFKIENDYYILEHKLTNGGGGSQNAEINEIIQFINFDEKNRNWHYISCLQGNFFKKLNENNTEEKVVNQYKNILSNLKKHPRNYFMNGKGFEEFINNSTADKENIDSILSKFNYKRHK